MGGTKEVFVHVLAKMLFDGEYVREGKGGRIVLCSPTYMHTVPIV